MHPPGAGRRAARVRRRDAPGNAVPQSLDSSTSAKTEFTRVRVGMRKNGRRTTGKTLILSSVHGGSSLRESSFPSLSIARPVLCAAAGDIHT